MRTVIAVDGGQSGCRAVVLAGGQVAAHAEAHGLQYGADSSGVETVRSMLDRLQAAVGGWPDAVDTVALALSGMPSEKPLRDRIAQQVVVPRFGPRRIRLSSDMPSAFIGALGWSPGAVVSAGSGVVAMAADGDGGVTVTGGGGALLGDDGSAYWIGLRGLRSAWRAHDREAGSAVLLESARARYGCLTGLPRRLRTSATTVADVAAFAVEVGAAAAAGDQTSMAILEQAGKHLVDVLLSAARRCFGDPDPGSSPPVLAWNGRLLSIPVLQAAFMAAAEDRGVGEFLRPPVGSPLDGAVQLALAASVDMFGEEIYEVRRQAGE